MPHQPSAPWVVVSRPVIPGAPLVFDSPHSGIRYPDDFHPAASRAAILTTWDAYVEELFAGVTAAGATLVAADFPRAYVDANRAANDIDPALLDGVWPGVTELSEHAGRGMGLIRRLALPGVPMYERKLSIAEVQRRIEGYYTPYRTAVRDAIAATVGQHGFVWHFNCHSMKSRGNAMNRDQGAFRPDFVLGDRDGTTAPREFTAWIAAWLAGRGYSVAINQPYRGADIVRTHGNPTAGCFSVQIEINRALYLDEATCTRGPRFAALQADLSEFARTAAARARGARGAGSAG